MRLGDLDALKEILFNDTQYGFWHDSMDGLDVAYTQRDLFKCIGAMPTIDAVPVVRCSDCIHRGKHECPMYHEEMVTWTNDEWETEWDIIGHDFTRDDGFCDSGERRGEL